MHVFQIQTKLHFNVHELSRCVLFELFRGIQKDRGDRSGKSINVAFVVFLFTFVHDFVSS